MGNVFFWFWLTIAIISIIVEIATNELKSFWFTISSLSSLIVNLINKEAYISQIIVFIIVSIFSMIYLRPIAQKYICDIKIDSDSLVGKTVTIVKKINKKQKGSVKYENLYFKGRSLDDSFEIGDSAIIIAVKKNVVYIKRINTHQN